MSEGRRMWLSRDCKTINGGIYQIMGENPFMNPGYDNVIVFTPEELRDRDERLMREAWDSGVTAMQNGFMVRLFSDFLKEREAKKEGT